MADKEMLRKALEHYIQQKQEKLKEVQQLDVMISGLSRDLGERITEQPVPAEEDASDSIGDAWRENEFGAAPTSLPRSGVRPDEFVGETYSNAARRYLEKVGQAVSMDDLLDALNRGGCPVGGKEPKKTLYISLIRDVRTFVPIPGRTGFLGLRKFYPNLKALKEKKDAPKAKRKKRSRSKARAKANTEGLPPKGKPEPKPKASVQPISVKQKSHPVTDQTAQKGEAM